MLKCEKAVDLKQKGIGSSREPFEGETKLAKSHLQGDGEEITVDDLVGDFTISKIR